VGKDDGTGFGRRRLLKAGAGAASLIAGGRWAPAAAQPAGAAPRPVAIADSAAPPPDAAPFRRAEFNMVGVLDVDWLTEPRFARLLDNMAASPGAFGAVRFFGALSSGTREYNFPATGGVVWPRPEAPIDFSLTLAALEALTSRGLVPFVALSFFPTAISDSPIRPPADLAPWRRLVRAFLDRVVERFGAAAVRGWWFEAWNEPNMPGFWTGSFERYLELYRATSEAVRDSGHDVRLGGPVAAYTPPEGASLMRRFVEFLAREPEVKCDFLSLHRKGIWGPEDGPEPRMERLTEAAEFTAETVLRLAPQRAPGLAIVNDEADMKVGFDNPYEPRMDERFPAWLAGLAVAHDGLSRKYAVHGMRFLAASDDANQQLIQGAFDGRRSIMTRASLSERDLFKLPVYNAYELLRLLGDRHGTVRRGAAECFPHTDLYHLVTAGEDGIAALFARFAPGGGAAPLEIDYALQDIPWPRVNIARFRIDEAHSNSFSAAGRRFGAGFPDAAAARRIRMMQELAVDAPLRSGVALAGGELRDRIRVGRFAALLHWITPFGEVAPAAPRWLEASLEDGNVVLRWTPNREPSFYSYELRRRTGDEPGLLVSPTPLRAAMWIDTAPPAGRHVYEVRAVSASGVAGDVATSPPVTV
jgi:Glycosyl hydrolases family 39